MRYRDGWLRIAVIVGTFVCASAPCAAAPKPSQDDARAALFIGMLEQDGFDVGTGTTISWDTVELYCRGEIASAGYASNEPYLRVVVPRSPRERPAEPSPAFRLAQDEAVVLVGRTPPPAKYFSYTPYLGWRTFPDARKYVFATLGDAVNNATVQTGGNTPFDAPVALIFTPDQGTEARVRAALRRAGYPAAIINTVVLPESMLRLGYGDTADELEIIQRSAIWQDPGAGRSYIQEPPLRVLRVTPRAGRIAPNPLPAPPLRVRGTGSSEMRLMNTLDQLRQSLIDKYGTQLGMDAVDVVPRPICFEGYDLIQRGIPMCGDTRDAFYVTAGYLSDPGSTALTLGKDEFLIIYGIDHVASGKATYMNVNVYADEQARLTVASIDDRELHGTARAHVADPSAEMYAYKVAHVCDESQCLALNPCAGLTLDSSTLLGIFTRIYLEPATNVGPAMPEILYDRVIKFSPRQLESARPR